MFREREWQHPDKDNTIITQPEYHLIFAFYLSKENEERRRLRIGIDRQVTAAQIKRHRAFIHQ